MMRRSVVTNWGPKRTHFTFQRLLQFLEVRFITAYIRDVLFWADLDSWAGWDHPMKALSSSTEGAIACSLPQKQSFWISEMFHAPILIESISLFRRTPC